MGAPQTYAWFAAHGESLDLAMQAPVDADPAGSRFVLVLKAERGVGDAALVFDSAYPIRNLTLEGYDAATNLATLAFRASAADLLQLAPGAYVGDLMQAWERGGSFGARRSRIAIITFTLDAGTTE